MAGQLTGKAGYEKGTIPLEEWVRRFSDKASFGNALLVDKNLHARDAALVLTDLTVVDGPTNVIRGRPVEIIPRSRGILTLTNKMGSGVVPLGNPEMPLSLETRWTLLQVGYRPPLNPP